METVVSMEVNEEAKVEDGIAKETGSEPVSLKHISDPDPDPEPDPVVYKLVRVDGEGRLVPATDEEVLVVEDLLEDEKPEHCAAECEQPIECIKTEGCSLQKNHVQSSEGISSVQLDAAVDLGKKIIQPEEIPCQMASASAGNSISQPMSAVGCPGSEGGLVENWSSRTDLATTGKPDFSKLKGEICLDNLTVKELQETFRATFGRETFVKDKRWLKRRISMGLTNSCDFSTTAFMIKDNEVLKKDKKENRKKSAVYKDLVVGVASETAGSPTNGLNRLADSNPNFDDRKTESLLLEHDSVREDPSLEQRTAKRVRKPTKRYIEEMSEEESRGSSGRMLGWPGDLWENFMPFMPSGIGLATRTVRRALGEPGPAPQDEMQNEVLKSSLSPGWNQQPIAAASENDNHHLERKEVELEKYVELKRMDSFEDNSDDNMGSVPASSGGMRRKHHRPWSLTEVVKLVEGVARYGAGRWSEIKRLAFASYSYRTSVDLKDKWRNLLRASFSQLPAEKGMHNARKHASIPIPAPILLRVRELAEMQAQVPANFSSSKFTGQSGGSDRSVHETRSGYL
ncbi:unnamed protein product [Coffea canephora]|uniref:DH200=94 genomic scaffold, scaffold_2816 n=1 Tax=Coffea canephora TaxID=49390 RepID=A0A068VKU6_COFCA|nr:unnamed protein product [Coffea canephora]